MSLIQLLSDFVIINNLTIPTLLLARTCMLILYNKSDSCAANYQLYQAIDFLQFRKENFVKLTASFIRTI